MDRGVLVTDIASILVKNIGYPNWNPFSRKKAVSCSENLAKCPKFEFQICQTIYFSTILGISSSKKCCCVRLLAKLVYYTPQKHTPRGFPCLRCFGWSEKLATWQTKLSSSEFWVNCWLLGVGCTCGGK